MDIPGQTTRATPSQQARGDTTDQVNRSPGLAEESSGNVDEFTASSSRERPPPERPSSLEFGSLTSKTGQDKL